MASGSMDGRRSSFRLLLKHLYSKEVSVVADGFGEILSGRSPARDSRHADTVHGMFWFSVVKGRFEEGRLTDRGGW